MARKYLGGSGEPLTVWISVAASTVLVFYGYDQGVFGNVIINQNFLDTFGNPSANMQGTMTSLYNIGCFFGAMSTLFTGDWLGRPRQIILGSTVIAIGAVIQTSSSTVAQMIVGRIIAGLGTGMNTATAGVWQAETSAMRSRGKLVIIQMANCITGFSISNWLTLGFSFAPKDVAWRFPLAFQIFFTLCIYALCPFLPDSPRLLIRKGKYDEAKDVLAALQGHGATSESASVRAQFDVIKDILDREHVNTYSWWQLVSGRGPPGLLRRMILGAWMQAMNQVSGINITSYYMSYIFINALGISELLSRILAACGSVDYLIFACLAYFVIERYGRRKVMMCSAAACSICWICIAIATGIAAHGGNSYVTGSVAVAFFFAFFASFGMGVLGVPWLYPTEINALEMRTKGASLAMATNWICNYAVVQATLPGVQNLGYKYWIVWAVICAAFIPITYFFYPETANRTLEDIDRFFETRPGVLIFNNKLATQLERPQVYTEQDEQIALQAEKGSGWSGDGEKAANEVSIEKMADNSIVTTYFTVNMPYGRGGAGNIEAHEKDKVCVASDLEANHQTAEPSLEIPVPLIGDERKYAHSGRGGSGNYYSPQELSQTGSFSGAYRSHVLSDGTPAPADTTSTSNTSGTAPSSYIAAQASARSTRTVGRGGAGNYNFGVGGSEERAARERVDEEQRRKMMQVEVEERVKSTLAEPPRVLLTGGKAY
ncbi:hypothetical protein LTR35_012559 [Friedmanniomyces endolithicus]|nr:hypothetical protein LTR35_012559 [Friedmanniomyces endolithicus]KAK0990356.1 hypothetical protein LTR54_012108 [Friedmanniomyces endolithicus]